MTAKKDKGRVLPPALQQALKTAGFDSLLQLAWVLEVKTNTLYAIRCGARRLSHNMASKIANALSIPVEKVPALFERPDTRVRGIAKVLLEFSDALFLETGTRPIKVQVERDVFMMLSTRFDHASDSAIHPTRGVVLVGELEVELRPATV